MPDTHACPATGCNRQMPRHLLFCPAHWRLCPTALQKKVLAAWSEVQQGITRANWEHYGYVRQQAIDAVNSLLAPKTSKAMFDPTSEGPYGSGA